MDGNWLFDERALISGQVLDERIEDDAVWHIHFRPKKYGSKDRKGDSFIDYLATYESTFIKQPVAIHLAGANHIHTKPHGLCPSPNKGKPKRGCSLDSEASLSWEATLHKPFLQFFQTMTVSEFFGLYKALNATLERVLNLIEEPAAMNSAEKKNLHLPQSLLL